MADQLSNDAIQDQILQLQDQVTQLINSMSRLQNQGQSGVTTQSPNVQGGISVPPVQSVVATNVGTTNGQTQVAVTFIEPSPDPSYVIDHYNIYVTRQINFQNTPVIVASVLHSPCLFMLAPDAANAVAVTVQTVLSNGDVNAISVAPTTTVQLSSTAISSTPGPANNNKQVVVTGMTLNANTPSAGNISWTGTILVYYNGSSYTITPGNTSSGHAYVTWNVGATTFGDANSWTSSDATPVFLIATNTSGVPDTAWNKMATNGIATGVLDGAVANIINLNATNVTTGTLAAGRIAAASLDTTKLNVEDLLVAGVTWTSNSPTSTAVSWSNGNAYYKGSSYSILSGNTTDQYIYWNVGDNGVAFRHASSFTPSNTSFLIATNSVGTYDLAWNKNATGGIAASHLNLPTSLTGPNGTLLLEGFTWTANSPLGDEIAWSAGQVVYQGITYSISSGHTGVGQAWVYWQLSSPTSFQVATGPTFPAGLGADDFIVEVNNSGIPEAIAEFRNSVGSTNIQYSEVMTFYNSSQKNVASIGKAGSGASGIIRLFDGTGSGSLGTGQKVIITGSDGLVHMGSLTIDRTVGSQDMTFNNMNSGGASSGSATLPGQPGGFLNCVVDGTTARIPWYPS